MHEVSEMQRFTGKHQHRYIWLDGREVSSENHGFWGALTSSALETVVIRRAQIQAVHLPLRTQLVIEIEDEADLEGLKPADIIMSTEPRLLVKAKSLGHPTCVFISIYNREALEQAWQMAVACDYAVVEFDLPTNIPLELIIARLQDSDTVLLKRETTLEGMQVAFGVMERGSDGVLISTNDISEILQVSRYIMEAKIRKIQLLPMVVEEVSHIGMGFRGCIDTTNLLDQDEGMLVGSTSAGGILVCSETHFLPYMNLRPFRVNAGSVHSYVWMSAEKVEYVTDLAVGSKMLAVNAEGSVREVVVGRVKIEMRPLLLIRGRVGNQELNVVVQDDWHIRVMGVGGEPRNATLIRPGEELLAYLDKPGRHVGLKVEEVIIER